MKKTYPKSKSLLVIIFSLFISVSFYSCDKEGQLSGTTWECDFFISKCVDSDGEEATARCNKVSVSFGKGINNDEKYYKADILIGSTIIYYPLSEWSAYLGMMELSADYTYKGKTLTISFIDSWGGVALFGQKWTGTVEGKTITLKNDFGETIMFYQKNKK